MCVHVHVCVQDRGVRKRRKFDGGKKVNRCHRTAFDVLKIAKAAAPCQLLKSEDLVHGYSGGWMVGGVGGRKVHHLVHHASVGCHWVNKRCYRWWPGVCH